MNRPPPLTPEQIKAAADRAEARSSGKEYVQTAVTEGEINAEIQKLAALPDAVYESQERRGAAERLGMRAGVLDRLVSAARPKADDEASGRIELIERAPCVSEVNGAALIADIIKQIETYIYLPENAKAAIALWTIASYAFDAFYIFPRLRLKSPTKGCGKSTLLDIIEQLVNKPLVPSNISGPALFRVIEAHRPTMLLDEADRYVGKNDDLISIIDAGHKKNGKVLRCVGDDMEPRTFSVWAPMAIAGIRALTGTIEDRSIMVGMERKPPRVKLKRFRGDRPPKDFEMLASRAARWAKDHQVTLGNADPEMPQLSNRAADNWLPLLAVADAIGGEWPARARTVAIQHVAADDDLGVQLLADIREVFTAEAMHTSDLLAKLIDKEGAPWCEVTYGRPLTAAKLGRMLGEFQIDPGQIKLNGINRNGYRRSALESAFAAYLPAQAALTPSQGSTWSTELKTQEKMAFQGSTSESRGRPLESEFPEQKQNGRGGRLEGGLGQMGADEWAADRCAYCGQPGTNQAPLNHRVWKGQTILLHAVGDCGIGWHAHQGPRP